MCVDSQCNCIFCFKDVFYCGDSVTSCDKAELRRIIIGREFDEADRETFEQCSDDIWSLEAPVHIECVSDVFAGDAVYHIFCSTRLHRVFHTPPGNSGLAVPQQRSLCVSASVVRYPRYLDTCRRYLRDDTSIAKALHHMPKEFNSQTVR